MTYASAFRQPTRESKDSLPHDELEWEDILDMMGIYADGVALTQHLQVAPNPFSEKAKFLKSWLSGRDEIFLSNK